MTSPARGRASAAALPLLGRPVPRPRERRAKASTATPRRSVSRRRSASMHPPVAAPWSRRNVASSERVAAAVSAGVAGCVGAARGGADLAARRAHGRSRRATSGRRRARPSSLRRQPAPKALWERPLAEPPSPEKSRKRPPPSARRASAESDATVYAADNVPRPGSVRTRASRNRQTMPPPRHVRCGRSRPGPALPLPAREPDRDARRDPQHPQHERHRAGELLAVATLRPLHKVRERRQSRRPGGARHR